MTNEELKVLASEYFEIARTLTSLETKKKEFSKKLGEELAERKVSQVVLDDLTVTYFPRISYKYTDEEAICKYLTMNGYGERLLKTAILVPDLNAMLKDSQNKALNEGLSPYFKTTTTYVTSVSATKTKTE